MQVRTHLKAGVDKAGVDRAFLGTGPQPLLQAMLQQQQHAADQQSLAQHNASNMMSSVLATLHDTQTGITHMFNGR